MVNNSYCPKLSEPRREKTSLRGFRTDPTQKQVCTVSEKG